MKLKLYKDDSEVLIPVKNITINGPMLFADGNLMAFFNRDESTWHPISNGRPIMDEYLDGEIIIEE